MRKIYLMLLLCFAYLAGSSQTTITIGSGTSTQRYPLGHLWGYERTASLYTTSEMASVAGNNITSIGWYATSTGNACPTKIYLATTATAPLTAVTWANMITGATLVFDGTLTPSPANAWFSVTLTTPFTYSGDNLLVLVETNYGGTGGGTYPNLQYTTTSANYQETWTADNAPPTGTGSATTSRTNIQITHVSNAPCSGMPSAGTAEAPVTIQCPNTSFNLSLSGTTLAGGLTYQWQSRPTSGGAWANIAGATTKNYTLASGVLVNTDFRAYVTCTNGGLTDTSTITSVTVSTLAPGGTYTINSAMPTGSGNFQSFADAADYIKCGIAGPIIFDVAIGSGPYNEQVIFPQIGGTSPTNTITINGNGETLTFSAGTATNPNTLSLNGADYFRINYLNIEATGATYAIAAHLYNAADNNKFSNCTFSSSITGTATTQAAFVISGAAASATTAGLSGSGNIVDSCTMVGGYYNTVIYGSSAAPYVVDNQITNSTARDFYLYGIYNVYARNTIIRHNIVERLNRTNSSTGYGIYLSTSSYNCTVDRNRVRKLFDGNLTSTSSAYCLYNAAAGAAGFENKWTNNLVSDIRSKGTIYGMYSASYDYVQVYHNTISLDDAAASGTTTTYGIYAYGTNGVNIKNNIVTISRGGTGTKYCLYLSTSTTTTSDNNVLYMNAGSGTNNIAYRTSAYATLGAWQAATNLDMNSFSVDPLYTSPSTDDYAPTETSIDNKGASLGVLRDILDTIRPLILPDMGAYEFGTMPAACSATPAPGNTVSSVPTACPNGNFTLSLEFPPSELGLTFQWQSADDAAFTTNVVNLGTASTQTTSQTAAKYYRCKVTCTNSGLFAYSNVLFVDMVTAACTDCAYPAIYATSASDEDILNVTVGTMNNTSDCTTTAPDPGSIKNQYSNYTQSVTGPVAERGETVNFSVQVGTCGGSYSNGVQIFIDFNQNGSFNDAGEMVYSQPTAFSGAHTVTGSFAIPMTAALGSTRMRVVAVETTFPTTTNYAQTSYSWGETEDYCFTINAATACAGTPAPGNTVANVAIACPNAPIHLSLQNSSLGSGITYEWQIADDALFTVNLASIGTNNVKDTSQTAAKYYRCKVTCTNSGLFAYSTPIFIDINSWINCYCTPTTTGGSTYYISGFTTTGGSTNINKTTSSGSASGYQDFFATDEVTINRGDALAYSINGSTSTFGFAIWIDFNQDGTFQSNEQVLTTSSYTSSKTGTVTIPNTALLGTTRMRVLAAFTPNNPSNPCTNSGSGEYQDYAITFTQATCATPGTVTVTPITTNSATVNFNAGGGNAFIAEYGAPGFTPGTDNTAGGGTIVLGASSPIALSGLTANTMYDVYVRQDCSAGGNGYSNNSMKVSFTTACDAATIPYTEDFNSTTGVALPNCTSAENAGVGNNWATAASPGAYGFSSRVLQYTYNLSNAANAWFYTAALNLTGGTAYTLSYKYGNNSTSYVEKMNVYYGTNPANASMTQFLADHPSINTANAATNTVDFTPATTGVYYIGFHVYSIANQYYLYVDDINVIEKVLPVTYTSFTGKKEGSVNLLSWQTATEINNTGFELQRSADNKNFSKLNFIASKANNGNSNAMLSYNYTDAKPLASSNYYRLKQIDRDGKANYSNTILLKGDNVKQVSIVGAYPNPARNILNVQIVAPAQERVSLVVTDITGKILQQETMVLNTGDNIKQIDVSRLTQGTYIIKTICSNGCESAVFKFTKN